jgi:hypothetical protein
MADKSNEQTDIYRKVVYVYFYENGFQNKSIHHLYSQRFTQTLSKTTTKPEGFTKTLSRIHLPNRSESRMRASSCHVLGKERTMRLKSEAGRGRHGSMRFQETDLVAATEEYMRFKKRD